MKAGPVSASAAQHSDDGSAVSALRAAVSDTFQPHRDPGSQKNWTLKGRLDQIMLFLWLILAVLVLTDTQLHIH